MTKYQRDQNLCTFKRHTRILKYIIRYSKKHKTPPSHRDIAKHLGVTRNAVVYHIDILKQRDLLTRLDPYARNLQVTEKGIKFLEHGLI